MMHQLRFAANPAFDDVLLVLEPFICGPHPFSGASYLGRSNHERQIESHDSHFVAPAHLALRDSKPQGAEDITERIYGVY
jgi:hypothetical protein